MTQTRTDIRLALPTKGRLEEEALEFLAEAGLRVDKPNPRQYEARIPALPEVTVLFQRTGDIVVSVRDGSTDFGIAGLDVVRERAGSNGGVLVLHDELGFGKCSLALAIPEDWDGIDTVPDLARRSEELLALGRPLRVATKFPNLVGAFLEQHSVRAFKLIPAEGALEAAPAIGYADIVADLVSTGTTLRDNRLRLLGGGAILQSQACLIANRAALQRRPELLPIAHQLLEMIEAHLRAEAHCLIFANMRGDTPESIAERMFAQEELSGLQGPTISPVIVRGEAGRRWFAVNIVVRKDCLSSAIAALRRIGGSGVVVSPVTYIFEEEPARYRNLLGTLEDR